MTSSKSSHYSSELLTTEIYEIPRCTKRTLIATILMATLSTAGVLILSIQAFTQCHRTNFNGLTIIIALVVFILYLASGYTTYSRYRIGSITLTSLALIITLTLCVHEIAVWICVEEADYAEILFCEKFTNSVNTCGWIPAKKPKGHKKALPATTVNGTDVHQPYKEVRGSMLVLSFLAFVCCFITFLVLCIFVKMGKPVYLNRRRHKTSIVVGSKVNVGLANRHKLKNIPRTRATDDETTNYDNTRSKVGAETKNSYSSESQVTAHTVSNKAKSSRKASRGSSGNKWKVANENSSPSNSPSRNSSNSSSPRK